MLNDPFHIYNGDIGSIRRKRHSFVEEDLLTKKEKKKEALRGKKYDSRVGFVFSGIAIAILIIFFKLLYLQILQGQYYLEVSEGNRIRIHSIGANRGLIYDRNNQVLADNTYNFVLEAIPVDLEKNKDNMDELLHEIQKITEQDFSELQEIVQSANSFSYQPIILKEGLTYEQAIQLKLLSGSYSGLVVGVGTKRLYTSSSYKSLSHLMGYLGKINDAELLSYGDTYALNDSIGKNGLEIQYEKILKGSKGREQVEVDAFGRKKETIAYQEAVAGDNIVLSLDIEIQNALENAMAHGMDKLGKKKGSGIVMDPNKGEILALVSLPSFDNNIFSSGISSEEFEKLLNDPDRPLFHRAIQGTYPSGSTIKPVLALAALEEGVVSRYTSIFSQGGLRVNQWFFPDWKAGGHGATNVTKALAQSVNTFFYMIGGGYENFEGLGLNRMLGYYKKAGIGSKLGIDIPGEAAGLLPGVEWKKEVKNERWYIGDTYHIAIGQGNLLVSPLHVASWTSMIANGGTLYKPFLMKKIFQIDGSVIKEVQPEILTESFGSDENIQTVKQGLRDAVTYGSAVRLADLPIEVAGKTGTAQWSSKNENHAWFTSFAPYKNPEIVVTILIEESGEGSAVAVPIAKEFYLWWAEYSSKKDNVDNKT